MSNNILNQRLNIKAIKTGYSVLLVQEIQAQENLKNKAYPFDLVENYYFDLNTGEIISFYDFLKKREIEIEFSVFPYFVGHFHPIPSIGKILWVDYMDLLFQFYSNWDELYCDLDKNTTLFG